MNIKYWWLFPLSLKFEFKSKPFRFSTLAEWELLLRKLGLLPTDPSSPMQSSPSTLTKRPPPSSPLTSTWQKPKHKKTKDSIATWTKEPHHYFFFFFFRTLLQLASMVGLYFLWLDYFSIPWITTFYIPQVLWSPIPPQEDPSMASEDTNPFLIFPLWPFQLLLLPEFTFTCLIASYVSGGKVP